MDKISLDKHKLDEEAERLPSEYHDAAYWEEKYTAELDVFKVQLDSMREKVELEVRSLKVDQVNEKYRLTLEKLTESTISSLVGQDRRVEELRTNMNHMKHLAGTYRALRKALDKKYGMIEVLSFLHNSGWFRRGSIDDGTGYQQAKQSHKTRIPQSVKDKFVG